MIVSSGIRRLRQWFSRLRSCGGFTLTELLVIIIMLGMLAAVVGMKSGWSTSRSNLRMALDQVVADLRFLQSRCMASMYSTTASFANGAGTYNIGGQTRTLPSGVTISSGLTVTYNSLGEYQTTADGALTLNSKGMIGSIKIYAISGDVEAY